MSSISIIGLHCRFPGDASSPDEFFEQLLRGQNFVQPTPGHRWNVSKFVNDEPSPGKAYTGFGHYINYDFTQFDALAFHMSPKEVEFIDPQQRLLLETTWQAFENAGIDILALSGRRVGVYVGGFTVDHLINQFSGQNRGAIDTHTAAGATLTMLANRVSYAFNLTGPSFSIDTACSSSLVAFAQATQDLRAGRCEMAIVGGVNFMLRPEYDIAMCKGRFLAPDGRSKSFDASADGYGRGEGCGVVILQPTAAAVGEGRDILAMVDAVGVNQDGRTSGITVPNPKAQEALMRQVLADSGIDPATVLYVEAHGTGTPLGDPLETSAIAAVYGDCEREEPCVIGSVKSNIGHLEAAAGIAGIIKATQILRHGVIPPIAGLKTPNPALPLDNSNIALATGRRPLGRAGAAARVAINSFGYGGTNAHVILAAPRADSSRDEAPTVLPELLLAPVSARSATSLPAAAAALADTLSTGDIADTLFTAARRRTHFEHRAVAWGRDADEVVQGLRQFASGQPGSRTLSGEALLAPQGGTVFVYTGMGPQWWGMGRGLWRSSPVYRDALVEADAAFARLAGFSILAEMQRDEADSRIGRTEFAQPANFLLQFGLTRVLAAAGLAADAVVGHSVGEVTSSWASGMLSLDDALRVSWHRSRVQARAAGQGGMLATALGEAAAQALADASGGQVDLAAINAPNATTLAGDVTALDRLNRELTAGNVFSRLLNVEIPYHSRSMDPLKPELMAALDGLRPQQPMLPLYSTVTGRRAETLRFDAAYWARNVREPVRFQAAIRRLLEDGYTHFVEVGPHPVLSRAILDVIKDAGASARHIATLNMKDEDEDSLPRCLAAAHVAGARLDWSRRHPRGRAVALPNYPFARERMWHESDAQREDRMGLGTRALGQRRAPGGVVTADLSLRHLNFLREHVVAGTPIMPGAAFMEAMLACGEATLPAGGGWSLTDISIEAPLLLDRDTPQVIELARESVSAVVRLHSKNPLAGDAAVRHASAALRPLQGARPRHLPVQHWLAATPVVEPVADAYERFRSIQLDYGNAFQVIEDLHRDEARTIAVARLSLREAQRPDAPAFFAHPSLVDGSFQAALALLGPGEGAYLPVGITEFRLLRPLPPELWARVTLVSKTADRLVCDILYADPTEEEVASIRGFTCAALTQPRVLTLPESDYAEAWDEVPTPERGAASPLIILAEANDALPVDVARHAGQAGHLRATICWDDPKLRESLHALTAWTTGQPCLALFFDSGLTGDDPAGEGALLKLKGLLAGLSTLGEAMPRLAIVTRSAMAAAPGDVPIPAQAAVLGFARVAYSEIEGLVLDVIDVSATEAPAEQVMQALASAAIQRELALRGGRRLAPMLRPTGLFAARPSVMLRPDDGRALCLGLDGIVERRLDSPAAGGIRVRAEALALPPAATLAGQPSQAGHYGFVGTILSGERAGERVAGLADLQAVPPGSLLDLTPQAAVMAAWPAGQGAAEGAGTALVAVPLMGTLARLDRPAGRRALMAQTPLGQALAAGLRDGGMAVDLIPADPALWEESALDEHGGYDLIALPLAEFANRFGFGRWLAPGGLLVDLAAEPGPLMLPEEAGQLVRAAIPGRGPIPDGETFERALQGIDPTLLLARPMALAEWPGPVSELRLVVIEPQSEVAVQPDLRPALRRDGTYLVTGGFGALGSQTALWLAACGAGRVVVSGRRGAQTPGAQALLDAIAARGSVPIALALDTADAAAVTAALAAMDTPEAPLRGVFHAAGVLADVPVLGMSDAELTAVLRPKALGAVMLDRATQGMKLDYFVLYSSIAAVIGNRRQANYCAANAALDALAHARRARGLPALSVNLGAISEAGMAADPTVEAHLRQIGLPAMPAEAAFAGIARALHAGVTQVTAAAAISWDRCLRYDGRGGRTARLHEVVAPYLDRLENCRAAAIRAELARATPQERVDALTSLLADIVAECLRIGPEALTPTRPLDEVGIDSLLAVEVQLAIEEALGVNVSTMQMIGKATLTSLAAAVLAQMGLSAASVQGDAVVEQQPVLS